MNVWLAAATVLLAATAPLGWVAVRRSPADGIVAIELAGVVVSLAMLAFAEGINRQPFGDLALILAALSFGGSLTFARFLELGERDE
jgi:multisubunit Na+/H+ antiporter MnhF subunit